MSTPLFLNALVRCSCWSVEGNQAAVNTFHYRVLAVGGFPSTDQDLADQVSTIYSVMKSAYAATTQYRGCQAQIILPLPIHVDVISVLGNGNGTVSGNPLPRQTTGLTSFYTNVAGRKGRGRAYWPFPSDFFNAPDGQPSAAYRPIVDGIANAIVTLSSLATGGRTASIAFVIYHRFLTTSDQVVSWLTRPVWATQRRRSDYGRSNSSPV